MIAAAALLGSFGAAGTMNGLWASPDARSHSFDGLKLAVGLPYGSLNATHKVQLSSSTAFAATDQCNESTKVHVAAPHRGLVAQLFQKPLVHATPRMVMADAASYPDAPLPTAPPAPPEPPAAATAPAAPTAPALAGMNLALNAPGSMKVLIAQAQADASNSAKLALQAAAAASAAERARAALRQDVRLDAPVAVSQSQYESLEQEFDQAVQRLELTQTLAARLDVGDFSFFVSSGDGKKTCRLGQIDGVCGLLSPADVARIRSEVETQVKLAQIAVRQSHMKLARARMTDG